MFSRTLEMTMPNNWLCYVMVDDVNKTAERVNVLGNQEGPDHPAGHLSFTHAGR